MLTGEGLNHLKFIQLWPEELKIYIYIFLNIDFMKNTTFYS